ncbi:MAG: HNH endonuclease [Acidobacteria bacterium]|nr:MAG: HNH endonuclease [Acidobacteriota bacterium]
MAKLETVRSLAWHRLPVNASLEQVFELALDLMIEKNHPSRRRERRERVAAYRNQKARENGQAESKTEPRQATMSARPKQANPKAESQDLRPRRSETRNRTTVTGVRYVEPAIRDRVQVRDQGQCTFKGSDGRRCGSTRALQIDHVRPVALGGDGTEENLRVLCAYHNRFEAERLLGAAYRGAGPPPV